MTRATPQERQRAELFAELADVIAREAEKTGVTIEPAQRIGASACHAIAETFGGTLIYIPANYAHRMAARDAEILRLAATQSPTELARVFGLTESTIYKILKRARVRREASPS